MQYYRSPSSVVKSFNYGARIEGRSRYLSNLRYTACVRVEENFCAIKWETDTPNSFMFGAPFEGNQTESGAPGASLGAIGGLCSADDFVGIDQGSADGVGPGEDRFCGNRLLDSNVVISRSKPFQLKVRSNADQSLNAFNSQQGYSLRYVQVGPWLLSAPSVTSLSAAALRHLSQWLEAHRLEQLVKRNRPLFISLFIRRQLKNPEMRRE